MASKLSPSDGQGYSGSSDIVSTFANNPPNHTKLSDLDDKLRTCCQDYLSCKTDFPVGKYEKFNLRYKMLADLGAGAFGHVQKFHDTEVNRVVAIKTIYEVDKAMIEVAHLHLIKAADDLDDHHIIQLKEHFLFGPNLHLVFEVMPMDLGKYLRNEYSNGMPIYMVRNIARQLCTAVNYLSSDRIKMIHGDIKPENILIDEISPTSHRIVLADFGLSCRRTKCNEPVQSCNYRAPEVILRLFYTSSIDMWSLACVFLELYTGTILFQPSQRMSLEAKIVEVLGFPPKRLIAIEPEWQRFCEVEPNYGSYVTYSPGSRTIQSILQLKDGGPGGRLCDRTRKACHRWKIFADFLSGILKYDPEERYNPAEALKHYFIAQ